MDQTATASTALSMYGRSHEIPWTRLAVLGFAVVFLIVGTMRVTEINGIGFKAKTKIFLMGAHLLGTVTFATAIALMALDSYHIFTDFSSACFLFGFFTLCPLHIYVALQKRAIFNQQTINKSK